METHTIYQDLARHLDSFPQGYPSTTSGVELQILAALFSPEEARLGTFLSVDFISLSRLVKLTGYAKAELIVHLKSMANKGLINLTQNEGELQVLLLPFIVGFYENQRERLDKEFAQLVETYFNESGFQLVSITPSFHRVIPVREAVDMKIEILPENDIAKILSSKNAWAVIDCICRKQQTLLDRACGHPIRNCLIMSDSAHAFDAREDMDALTFDEALDVLRQAADAGLVHTVANHREGLAYICNCCTCSCGILRGIAEARLSNVVARSAYRAVVAEEDCVGCGECETVCQFSAIQVLDAAEINPDVCVGCGVCVRDCPEGAITLTLRPAEDILAIPNAFHDWLEVRRESRDVILDE